MSNQDRRSSQIEIEVKDLAPAPSTPTPLQSQESGAFDGDDGGAD